MIFCNRVGMTPTRSGSTVEEFQSALGSVPQRTVAKDLERVASECSQPDWNGEGSAAISPAALRHAKGFNGLLDLASAPLPEAIPEPDGDLALEWHVDDSHWLILSFRSDGTVNYAWKAGTTERASGTGAVTPRFVRLVRDYLSTLVPVSDAAR